MDDNVARTPSGTIKDLRLCGKERRYDGGAGQVEPTTDRKQTRLTLIEGGKGKENDAATGADAGSEREEKRLPAVIGIPYSSGEGVNIEDSGEDTGEKEEDIMKNWAKYILMATAVALAAFGLFA